MGSRPRCSVFLPGSIPMVTTAVSNLRGMAWFLLLIAPQACSLVGREHGRSIPFSDISPTKLAGIQSPTKLAGIQALCIDRCENIGGLTIQSPSDNLLPQQ